MIRKITLPIIIVCLLFASGCKTGLVSGTVTFKGVPCTQGEPENKVPPCQGFYPGYEVKVLERKSEKVKGTTKSDAKGNFSFKLPTGVYVIYTQKGISPEMKIANVFAVTKGQKEFVNLFIDTGVQ